MGVILAILSNRDGNLSSIQRHMKNHYAQLLQELQLENYHRQVVREIAFTNRFKQNVVESI